MSDRVITEKVLKQMPPRVLITAVVAGAVVIVILGWCARDAYLARLALERPVVQETRATADDSAGGEQAPVSESPANKGEGAAATSEAPQPQERMLPESFVLELIEHIDGMQRHHREEMAEMVDRLEERHREELARRDRQFDRMDERLAGLQTRIDEMGQAELDRAWAEVDRFRQENGGAIHGRPEFLPAPERRGPEPPPQQDEPAAGIGTAAVVDDPFDAAEQEEPAKEKPTFQRRSGYLNVNPDRQVQSGGFRAGSAKARLRDAEERHRSAINWTQRYYSRSGSSRVLGEMEAGGR